MIKTFVAKRLITVGCTATIFALQCCSKVARERRLYCLPTNQRQDAMDKVLVSDTIIYSSTRLVDDAQKDKRDHSHSIIEFLLNR